MSVLCFHTPAVILIPFNVFVLSLRVGTTGVTIALGFPNFVITNDRCATETWLMMSDNCARVSLIENVCSPFMCSLYHRCVHCVKGIGLYTFIYNFIFHNSDFRFKFKNSSSNMNYEIFNLKFLTTRYTRSMKSLRDILAQRSQTIGKQFISREFQDYGYRLAQELNDLKNKSLYMKLAKTLPRRLLENARMFVKDATTVRSRARLFMWKLKELRQKRQEEKRR